MTYDGVDIKWHLIKMSPERRRQRRVPRGFASAHDKEEKGQSVWQEGAASRRCQWRFVIYFDSSGAAVFDEL